MVLQKHLEISWNMIIRRLVIVAHKWVHLLVCNTKHVVQTNANAHLRDSYHKDNLWVEDRVMCTDMRDG